MRPRLRKTAISMGAKLEERRSWFAPKFPKTMEKLRERQL
jgi:hypothetical protein